jgi:uncharacterized protein (TIGR02145 family)
MVIPTVTTASVTAVTSNSATIGGNITQDGGAPVTARGVAYGTSSSPTTSGSITNDGTGTGVFTSTLTGLTPSTTYYVRAYATNSVGTAYGNEVTFTTPVIPAFTCGTSTVSDVDGNSYNTVLIGLRCWTQSNLKVSKYRNGDSIPTGLSNSAWATTSSGAYTFYNNDLNNDIWYGKLYNHYAVMDNRGLCPTGWHVPTDEEWSTLDPFLGGFWVAGGALKSTVTQPNPGGWNLPNTGATNSSGFTAGPAGIRYNSGTYGNLGFSGYWWSSTISGTNAWLRSIANSSDNHNRLLGNRLFGLSVRCFRDINGTINFIPTITTTVITAITATSATTGGNVAQDGGTPVTARGVAYGLGSGPTTSGNITIDGSGTCVFTSNLTGLTPSTTYFVRAYATNAVGTAYGNEVNFSTLASNVSTCQTTTISDIDGNIYNTVQIGTQCWTQSNLKVSKYRNGDNIPTGLSSSAWGLTTDGAYAIYDNDSVNDILFGKLYNHYAVTESRGLCPTGWHVPSDGEWTTLETFLGGSSVAGGALKSTATQPTLGGWNSPNTGTTNSSGFTALPGGLRNDDGLFYQSSTNGYWWSSSLSCHSAWYRLLFHNSGGIARNATPLPVGFSVRCIRD